MINIPVSLSDCHFSEDTLIVLIIGDVPAIGLARSIAFSLESYITFPVLFTTLAQTADLFRFVFHTIETLSFSFFTDVLDLSALKASRESLIFYFP
jgi:hypothetical protein